MRALTCSKCGDTKSHKDFHRSSRNSSGRQTYCKPCQCAARRRSYNPDGAAAYAVVYRELQAEEIRETSRRYRQENPLRERLRRGRNRASKRGLPADAITPDELLADWKRRGIDPDRCVYTGEALQPRWHIDHMFPLRYSDSPGHVLSNLVPCNGGVNKSKGGRHWLDFLADRAEAAA